MNPKALQLQERTQRFASLVIAFCETLSHDPACRQIVDQLADAAVRPTAITARHAAHGRPMNSSRRSASPLKRLRDARLAGVLVRTGFASEGSARALIQEADELTAIFVASRTAKKRREQREQLNQQLRTAKRSRRRS